MPVAVNKYNRGQQALFLAGLLPTNNLKEARRLLDAARACYEASLSNDRKAVKRGRKPKRR
jgi:Zn-dependent membrane protease YugP